MRHPLNLASRPLRNERLPTLLLALACVALVAVSVYHAFVARDLLPERTSGVDGELVALEQELAGLRQESAELTRRDAPLATLQEWAAVRRLVDRRTFSWSALLGCLEEVVPSSVRLLSVAPAGEAESIRVQLQAAGRTVEDGLEFLAALQAREEFKEPFLNSVSEQDTDVRFSFSMGYVPAHAERGGVD